MYLDKRTSLDKSQECDCPVGTVIIWSSHLSLCCGPQMITHFLAPFQKKKKKDWRRDCAQWTDACAVS